MAKHKDETYYKEHYQRYRETHLRYARRDEPLKRNKGRKKKGRDQLSDVYLKDMLRKMGLPRTKEFIELQRQHVILKRLIKTKK